MLAWPDWDELDHSASAVILCPRLTRLVAGPAWAGLVQLLGSTLLTLQRNINLTNKTNTNTSPGLNTTISPLGQPQSNFYLLSLASLSCWSGGGGGGCGGGGGLWIVSIFLHLSSSAIVATK